MNESSYSIYNRYSNISARGTCISISLLKNICLIESFLGTRTAVRLTGKHRHHDYINANQIQVDQIDGITLFN